MPDRRSSPASDEPAPRSSAPTVASASSVSSPPDTASKLPVLITALGLLGIVAYTLLRLTIPADQVAIECLHAALAESGDPGDLSLDVEIVTAGKLEVGGPRSTQLASGPLSDPGRRRAIEHCRAVYAKQTGVSASAPLLSVETSAVRIDVKRSVERGSGATLEKVQYPLSGARVSVENLAGQGECVTSSSGQCELALQNVAHDARLGIAALLANGVVIRRTLSVLELLRDGLTLEAQERAPALDPPVPDCQAARRSLDERTQLTPIPAGAAGHRLDARVDVMSSGIVADIRPAAGADPTALSALRSQLASLRGLPGPCSDLLVSLHY